MAALQELNAAEEADENLHEVINTKTINAQFGKLHNHEKHCGKNKKRHGIKKIPG